MYRKLTEVKGRSRWCTENWQIVVWTHKNLTEVDGRFCRRTESWRKVQWPYGHSVNFVNLLCIWGTIYHLSVHQWDLPSTSVTLFVQPQELHKLSVHPWDLPWTFSYGSGILCQIFMWPRTFCQLFCVSTTFRQHQSTFRASAALTKLASTFRETGWPSVNISCIRRTCQLRSTSRYYSVVQAVQQRFLSWTHEIFSYDSCYFHYSVVWAVQLCWTSLN